MKYQMTLFIAEKKINDFMEMADLKGTYKEYVKSVSVSFKATKNVTEEYFTKLIEKSKEDMEDMWIPAIEFCGTIYHDPEVKVISDGEKEMFLTK